MLQVAAQPELGGGLGQRDKDVVHDVLGRLGVIDERHRHAEQARQIYEALSRVPYEQREVIALRIKAGMKFKEIAAQQGASVLAVQARYRHNINKLQSSLNGRL